MARDREDGGAGPPAARADPGPDPYAWMRDHDQPALREYLAAERAYYDRQARGWRGLQDDLLREMTARRARGRGLGALAARRAGSTSPGRSPACSSSSSAGRAGPASPARCCSTRTCCSPTRPARAATSSWACARSARTGGCWPTRSTSPATRCTSCGSATWAPAQDLPERIERTYYGLAWAADSASLFYTVTDQAYRPFQVWRHELGTDPAADVLVYREDDQRFDLIVRATRSGGFMLIETESRDTTETLVIPAATRRRRRRCSSRGGAGMEYRADHADGPDGGDFYLVTNDGADGVPAGAARRSRAPAGPRWTEVHRRARRTPGWCRCDVFGALPGGGAAARRRRPSCGWWTARPGASG